MANTLDKQINLQKIASDTYTASWHVDWTVTNTLHGGCVAAVIHHAAATHFRTDSRFRNQPHILNLHLNFLRACERCESTITVTTLKVGAAVSTLQLQLSQNGQVKVTAQAMSTNFDKSLGPSVPTSDSWTGLLPLPNPTPDFDRVLAQQSEPNWVPARLAGEVLPMTGRILGLYPRGGFVAPGVCDSWHSFLDGERITDTYMGFLADFVPSMSDTLLKNRGLYDGHVFQEKAEQWAGENPGITCLFTNTVAEAATATTLNQTLTIDIEFKRSFPEEGLRFVLTRTVAKMLRGGRMDVDLTICDEDMELVASSRQIVLVLEAGRKFRTGQKSSDAQL